MSDHLKVVLAALSNVANLVAVAVAVTTRAEVINEMNMFDWGWKVEGVKGGKWDRFEDWAQSIEPNKIDRCTSAP